MLLPIFITRARAIFEIFITSSLTDKLGEKVLILLHLIVAPLLNVVDIGQNGPMVVRVGVGSG